MYDRFWGFAWEYMGEKERIWKKPQGVTVDKGVLFAGVRA